METEPFVAVAVIIDDQDQFLLIKRARPPFRGQWSFISGTGASKKGLPPAEAVIDEVTHDIGATFKGELLFGYNIDQPVDAHTAMVFVGEVNRQDIKPNLLAVSEVKWFNRKQITRMRGLAFENDWILKAVSRERIDNA